MKKSKNIEIDWYPQPRQLTCLRAVGLSHPFDGGCPKSPSAKITLYGGAAGGGKSDALLAVGIIAGTTWKGINIGYFRREYPQLEGPGSAVLRSRELMSGWANYNGKYRRWTMPGGSILQFCAAKDEADVFNYQSLQFDIILVDEATQFTRFMLRYLLTRNRATKAGIIPFMLWASNPGNIGHAYIKQDFVSCGPPEGVHIVEVEPGQFESHLFVPAKLSDNQILEVRDPQYRQNLEAQPEHIKKQLLDGDWDAFEGMVFAEWDYGIHVCKYFDVPAHWKRWLSVDNGYTDPFAWYWFTVDEQGKVFIYKEYTREPSSPKVAYSDQARKAVQLSNYYDSVRQKEVEEKYELMIAGHEAWNTHPLSESGKSIIDYYNEGGMSGFIPAMTDRRLRAATWHEYLKPYTDVNEGKKTAKVQVFETCRKLIETLPMQAQDPNDPEKVAESDINHWYDSAGYGLIAWHKKKSKAPKREKTELEKDKERIIKAKRINEWKRRFS